MKECYKNGDSERERERESYEAHIFFKKFFNSNWLIIVMLTVTLSVQCYFKKSYELRQFFHFYCFLTFTTKICLFYRLYYFPVKFIIAEKHSNLTPVQYEM